MVSTGDVAPDFTLPCAGGSAYNDVSEWTLSEAVRDGPVVLAFIPAAFTSGCTEEMCTFRDSFSDFESLDAQVLGISVDLPFAQNIFIQEHDLPFPMLSDWEHEVTRRYGVEYEGMYDLIDVSERSVFVIDGDGVVQYSWIRDNGNPDFGELIAEIADEIAAIQR